MIAEMIELFLEGSIALLAGISGSISSPDIRRIYARFAIHLVVIALLGYMAVSATMLSVGLLSFLLVLGPVLGPLIFSVVCFIGAAALAISWAIGRFPKQLFVGSFGILRPFFTASQISFLLASVLIPWGCDGFMLEGISVVCARSSVLCLRDADGIRREYRSPSLLAKLRLFGFHFILGITVKALAFVLSLGRGPWLINPLVDSFLLGSQLTSTYTVRVRKMPVSGHTRWCMRNWLRILGFSLPLHFLRESYGLIGTFLGLGLSFSVSAFLVEPLIVQDAKRAT